jgi:hypothetical protein
MECHNFSIFVALKIFGGKSFADTSETQGSLNSLPPSSTPSILVAQTKPLRRVRSLLQRTILLNEPIDIKLKLTKNTIIRDLSYDLRGVFDALIWIV